MVSGDTIVAREYFDPVTMKMVEVEMSVRDHLYLKAIAEINTALRRPKRKWY